MSDMSEPCAEIPNTLCTVAMFGGLRVTVGDRVVSSFQSQKATALLAYLSFHRSQTHSRELLIELLWPECDPESGRNRLNVTLSRLRQDLGSEAGSGNRFIISDRHLVGINPESVDTDVARFHAFLAASASGDDAARLSNLKAAIALYCGPLLPGFYDSWISTEQERLREHVNQALLELVLLLESQGQVDEAIEHARRVISSEPLLEKAHESLIRLLIRAGRPADALQQYRTLERLLKEELDIAPDVETQALLEPVLQTTARPVVSSRPPITSNNIPNPQPEEVSTIPVGALQPPKPSLPKASRFAAASLAIFALALIGAVITHVNHTSTPIPTAAIGGKLLTEWKYTTGVDERDSEPSGMASDASGNLVLCGFVKTAENDVDMVTLKFESDGDLLWKRRWNNPRMNDCDRARYIDVDGEGNVYVTGDTYNGDRKRGGTEWDVVTIKYRMDGKFLWARHFNNSADGDDAPAGMSVDSSGNAYVLANIDRPNKPGAFAILQYDAEGRRVWLREGTAAKQFGETTSVLARALTADRDPKINSLIVVGEVTIEDANGKRRPYIYTASFQRDGKLIWERRHNGKQSLSSTGWNVTRDLGANVYVAGTERVEGDLANTDVLAVLKYDANGTEVWSTRCYPSSISVGNPTSVAVDGAGNVVTACTHRASSGSMGAYNAVLNVYGIGQDGRLMWHDFEHFVTGQGLAVSADGKATVAGFGLPLNRTGDDPPSFVRTWQYAPNGQRLWTRDYQAQPVEQSALYQDSHGNIVTAGRFHDGHPRMLLLKYSP